MRTVQDDIHCFKSLLRGLIENDNHALPLGYSRDFIKELGIRQRMAVLDGIVQFLTGMDDKTFLKEFEKYADEIYDELNENYN